MTAIEILDSIPCGVIIESWDNYVPLGHPEYWGLSTTLEVLARLDNGFRKVGGSWYKLTEEQIVQAKKYYLIWKWCTLWTEPWLLDY
jgi:hypothetical protein